MKTVMIFGTFDILHLGHINMFEQAKKLGDKLIAIVARDVNVEKIKGAAPVHNEKERKALLDHIELIDEVYLGDKKNVFAAVAKWKPDVIALGYDQVMFVDEVKEKIQELGLQTKIVRLKAHKEKKQKSGKIKHYIETQI